MSKKITFQIDKETAELLTEIENHSARSRSELIRSVLRFYNNHRMLFENNNDKVHIRAEMLSAGEYIVLDIDHWILLLRFIESHPESEEFWELHRRVCKSHAEQFKSKNYNIKTILKRFEACNLFKISEMSDTTFTLILNSNIPLAFLEIEFEEILNGLGLHAKLQKGLLKLRAKIIPQDCTN